jgi:hypothetical protein
MLWTDGNFFALIKWGGKTQENRKRQIIPYGILFLTFINTNVFYLLSFKFSRKLVKTMAFSFEEQNQYRYKRKHTYYVNEYSLFSRLSSVNTMAIKQTNTHRTVNMPNISLETSQYETQL